MSENMVLKILEVIQDQLQKIREEAAENKAEVLARIDQLAARTDKRITGLDLARGVQAAQRQAETEDRLAALEAELKDIKAAASK
jgi:benzoyl-CoA reductase/2-hydroxyglutaryl-CoA dehydratase subunit BcrC/BadD/HgdB